MPPSKSKNTGRGATLISRSILNSEIWYSKPSWWLKVWVYLINEVTHTEYKSLKAGEGHFTYAKIHKDCHLAIDGVGVTSIKNLIKWLKERDQIETKKTARGFIVLLKQYKVYQDFDSYKGQKGANLEPQSTEHTTEVTNHTENTPPNHTEKSKNTLEKPTSNGYDEVTNHTENTPPNHTESSLRTTHEPYQKTNTDNIYISTNVDIYTEESKSKKKTKKKDGQVPEEYYELARYFWQKAGGRFRKMNPKKTDSPEKLTVLGEEWAGAFEKMVRLDGCTLEYCWSLIRWLFESGTRDSLFWAEQIQSPLKFRKKNQDGVQYWRVLDDKMNMQEMRAAIASAKNAADETRSIDESNLPVDDALIDMLIS